MGPAHRLLETAAAPTLERIRRDRQKAPTQLQPLLAYLETHLFDPDLDANQLKRACGVRDNSLPIYFHHALSLPPYAYIEDCRLEVACRLLRDTELKVWQIAQLLGYSTLQVFSRAFDRWSGLRPSVFRRRAKLEAQETDANGIEGKSERREEDSLISLSTLRRAINGGLTQEDADDLARRLVQLYPESFKKAGNVAESHEEDSDDDPTTTLSADESWELLRNRPRREQLELMRGRGKVASIDLYHRLIAEGREITRADIARGIDVLSLALDCLEQLADSLNETEYRQLEVGGCTWLAHSYRLACPSNLNYDFSDVEKMLERGREALKPSCDPAVRAEFLLVKSAARMDQRRLDEALDLANELVLRVSSIEQAKLRVMILSNRARILYMVGRVGDGISDLWKAYRLLAKVEDRWLKVMVYQTLSYGLTLEGQHQEARRFLPMAKALCDSERKEDKTALSYLTWTEGLIEQDTGHAELAEQRFGLARREFYAQGLPIFGAMVALDMAQFCCGEGRLSEAKILALEVVEVFEGLKVQQEVVQAIQVLQQALRAEAVCTSTLKHVRSTLIKNQMYS